MNAVIEKIIHEIEDLPKAEYIELRHWFTETDFKKWDNQIEVDSNSGKLDALVEEAIQDKKNGNVKPL